jgi:hypothetical protein
MTSTITIKLPANPITIESNFAGWQECIDAVMGTINANFAELEDRIAVLEKALEDTNDQV